MTIPMIILGAAAVLALLITAMLLLQYVLGTENSLREEAGNLEVGRSPTGLPDTPYYTTMKPHVQGFARGMVVGIVLCLVSALLACLIL